MSYHQSSFEEKVAWFMRHPDCCAAWPRLPWDDRAIFYAMQREGLIGPGSNFHDLGDFGKPVAEARARLRSNARVKEV